MIRIGWRLARTGLLLIGLLALLGAAAQFTSLPWRAYKRLATLPVSFSGPPTHILLMGGSGIPGESGLMRTYYAARIAARNPQADLLVALPLDAAGSPGSQAYLDELVLRGVAPERLRILSGGHNTREQALRLAGYFADWTNEPPRILIVTSPEHIRRTAASIRKTCNARLATFPRRASRLAALPAFALSIEDPPLWSPAGQANSPSSSANPAEPTENRHAFALLRYNLWANLGYSLNALREYTALLYYRWRGWI